MYEDEDDENEEGNWRNDYFDEDLRFFENEDLDYVYGIGKFLFNLSNNVL